jgi:hypothetical protein
MAIPIPADAVSVGTDFVEAAEHALATGRLERVSDAELERIMTAFTRQKQRPMVRPRGQSRLNW